MSSFVLASAALLLASSARAQVTATGTNGPTNPPEPTMGSYNQSSYSRLISINSYDDFCLWAPPTPGDTIGDTEAEQVAWCTKPRNDARLIPDGTISSVHFVKTPLYVQIQGFGDFTKINIQNGDEGGELDPHGATGEGNPVGGNVTSDITGETVFYEEWMSYMSYNQFCFRVCTAENATYSAAVECEHTYDLMGCEWVMPGDYTDNEFTVCDADAAYPPGVYPVDGGASTSTFHQRYTNPAPNAFTIGVTVTPSAAYSIPASSNCQTMSSISNGVTDIQTAAAVAVTAIATSGSSAVSGNVAAVTSALSSAVSVATSAASVAVSEASKATKVASSSGAVRSASIVSSASATANDSSDAFRSFSVASGLATVGLALLGAGAVLL